MVIAIGKNYFAGPYFNWFRLYRKFCSTNIKIDFANFFQSYLWFLKVQICIDIRLQLWQTFWTISKLHLCTVEPASACYKSSSMEANSCSESCNLGWASRAREPTSCSVTMSDFWENWPKYIKFFFQAYRNYPFSFQSKYKLKGQKKPLKAKNKTNTVIV